MSENLFPAYAVPLSERSWIVREVAKMTSTEATPWLAREMELLRRDGVFMRCHSVTDYVMELLIHPRQTPQE